MTKSKKTVSKRTLAVVLAVVLLILGTAAAVFCWGARDAAGHWAKNPTITAWFDYWGKGAPTNEGNGDDESNTKTQKTVIPQADGLFVLTTRNAAAPVALYSAQTQANTNTATITAQITPANADYSAVNWTCNDSAVQIITSEENPLKVQVSLTAPLVYTATITCEVVSVTTITATCTVDYMHFPDKMTVTAGNIRFGAENDISVSPVNEDMSGTINDFQCVIESAEVSLNPQVITAITNRLIISDGWDMSAGTLNNDKLVMPSTPYEAFFAIGFDDQVTVEDFRKTFFAVCNGGKYCAVLDVSVNLVYNGKTYQSYDARCDVGFDSSTYGVAANGVQLGDGVIITD